MLASVTRQVIKPDTSLGGGVTRFVLPSGKAICQITTFCPSTIGPGPTHLFLLEEQDQLLLVDTGITTRLAKLIFYHWRNQPLPPAVASLPDDLNEQQLKEGLALLGYDLSQLSAILITHGHLDHYLLGPRLVEQFPSIQVVAHLFDTDMICNPWELLRTWVMRRPELLALGMPPPDGADEIDLRWAEIPLGLRVDRPIIGDGPLELAGRKSDLLTVRNLPGHTAGSVCLLAGGPEERKIMLCGDLLLNPITPHPNDLLAYLRSLRQLERMEDVGLVLPAHGLPIQNLQQRCQALVEHHRRRLKLAYEALRQPGSVWGIATMDGYFDVCVDPRKFNPLAGQEAFVHVELLILVDAVKLADVRNGTCYYQAGGEPFAEVYQRIADLVVHPPLVAPRTRRDISAQAR